jgi:ssDNA-specific exonuclease RecJ
MEHDLRFPTFYLSIFVGHPKKKELDQTKKYKKKQETLETDTCRVQHWRLH